MKKTFNYELIDKTTRFNDIFCNYLQGKVK